MRPGPPHRSRRDLPPSPFSVSPFWRKRLLSAGEGFGGQVERCGVWRGERRRLRWLWRLRRLRRMRRLTDVVSGIMMMDAVTPVHATKDAAPEYRLDPLWIRLQQFILDDAELALPFSLRLARDNGWSRHHAGRVIAEYKKFCYLALMGGGGHAVGCGRSGLASAPDLYEELLGRVLRPGPAPAAAPQPHPRRQGAGREISRAIFRNARSLHQHLRHTAAGGHLACRRRALRQCQRLSPYRHHAIFDSAKAAATLLALARQSCLVMIQN